MNKEEALEILKKINVWNFSYDSDADEILAAISFGIEALEKSVGKKPNDIKYLGYTKLLIGKCPICNNSVNSEMKCCDNCGQIFNWEEN